MQAQTSDKETHTRPREALPWCGLMLCLALAAFLRMRGLRNESAWGDEALTLLHLPASNLAGFLRGAFGEDPRLMLSPVYYLLEYAWSAVFGGSLAAIRMLSVTLGLVSVGLIFLVARRLFNPRAGVLAAFLLAASLVQVYYSQEVRFYALMGVFSLLSFHALIRLLESGGVHWGLVHWGCNALLLGTHAFAPLFFLAQGVFLLATQYRRIRWLFLWGAAQGMILVLFAVWLKFLHYDFAAQSQAYNDVPPTLRTLANTFIVFAGGRFSNLNPAPFMPGRISLDGVLAGMSAAIAGASLILLWKNRSAAANRNAWLLALCWWLIPVTALYAVALVWRPCYFDRYVLYSSFGLYVVMAGTLVNLPAPRLRHAAIGVIVMACLYQSLVLPRPFRADYQAAARAVAADPAPNTVVHALKQFNALGVRYSHPVSRDRIVTFEGYPELCAETLRAAEDGKTVWAVFYRWDNIEDFVQKMHDASLHCFCREFGGMPPLSACRVFQ